MQSPEARPGAEKDAAMARREAPRTGDGACPIPIGMSRRCAKANELWLMKSRLHPSCVPLNALHSACG